MPMAAAASLAGALYDLASPAGRLAAFRAVTDHVYGPCPPGQAASWRPRTYADNKSRWNVGHICQNPVLARRPSSTSHLTVSVIVTAPCLQPQAPPHDTRSPPIHTSLWAGTSGRMPSACATS